MGMAQAHAEIAPSSCRPHHPMHMRRDPNHSPSSNLSMFCTSSHVGQKASLSRSSTKRRETNARRRLLLLLLRRGPRLCIKRRKSSSRRTCIPTATNTLGAAGVPSRSNRARIMAIYPWTDQKCVRRGNLQSLPSPLVPIFHERFVFSCHRMFMSFAEQAQYSFRPPANYKNNIPLNVCVGIQGDWEIANSVLVVFLAIHP